MTASIEDQTADLKFRLITSIRYHMRRAAFFMKWQRFTSFIGVMFGSAAVATLLGNELSEYTVFFALLVSGASALDLVIGTGQHAWLHNDLRKRFIELEALLAAQQDIDHVFINDMKLKVSRIEADEPPARSAIILMAYNDTTRAMYSYGDAKDHLIGLCWLKRFTANLIDWDVSKNKSPSDIRTEQQAS